MQNFGTQLQNFDPILIRVANVNDLSEKKRNFIGFTYFNMIETSYNILKITFNINYDKKIR